MGRKVLSRSGFELNEIWYRQEQLVESDKQIQKIRRSLNAGDESAREPLVLALRRAEDHDEADRVEIAPHVHGYQTTHATLARNAWTIEPYESMLSSYRPPKIQKRVREQNGLAGDRNGHFSKMLSTANKQLKNRLGRNPYEHELGEHIAKHLDPKKAIHNHNLTQQVLDVHEHRFGYGRNYLPAHFHFDAQRHRLNRPLESRTGAHYDRYRGIDVDVEEHTNHTKINALKRSLTLTGAGEITRHIVDIQRLHSRSVSIHEFDVRPVAPGAKVKHVDPRINDHRDDNE